jgi:uncharacterized lipoprotein YddW (UPF0748 family)
MLFGLAAATVVPGCVGGPDASKPVPLTPAILDVRKPADPNQPPEPMREFRAAWVATVGNIDWPTKPGLAAADQQKEALAILDRAAEIHLNAIVLQVRTTADALYDSKIEPWSAFLTGTQGKAPEPYYDPLKFWVDEAHKRGIELHAWFNPYRTRYGGKPIEAAESHISKARPDLVKDYGKMGWMDPGEPDAADQSYRVFMDVVERYDVDGVHIDDYFYPYPEKAPGGGSGEMPFPDDASYAKYQQAGGKLARPDWRRQNVTDLVRKVYEGVKQRKPAVKFGISPFGIPRPGLDGIPYVAGFDQYEKLYADTVLWLKNGWCDYFVPQLYWKTSAPQQPYPGLLNWWAGHNPMGRHVFGGLYTSRLSERDAGWSPDEILGQIMITRVTPGAHGEVHFSMKALTENRRKISDTLRDGLYAEPALPPVAGWLDKVPPPAPRNVTVERPAMADRKATANRVASAATRPAAEPVATEPAATQPADTMPAATEPTPAAVANLATEPARSVPATKGSTGRSGTLVTWTPGVGEAARVWAVQYKAGNVWKLKVVPGDQTETTLTGGGPEGRGISHVGVAAVDRCGNLSKRATAGSDATVVDAKP